MFMTLNSLGLTASKHNNIVVFMMLQCDPNTGYLPPGVHAAKKGVVLIDLESLP